MFKLTREENDEELYLLDNELLQISDTVDFHQLTIFLLSYGFTYEKVVQVRKLLQEFITIFVDEVDGKIFRQKETEFPDKQFSKINFTDLETEKDLMEVSIKMLEKKVDELIDEKSREI